MHLISPGMYFGLTEKNQSEATEFACIIKSEPAELFELVRLLTEITKIMGYM